MPTQAWMARKDLRANIDIISYSGQYCACSRLMAFGLSALRRPGVEAEIRNRPVQGSRLWRNGYGGVFVGESIAGWPDQLKPSTPRAISMGITSLEATGISSESWTCHRLNG